MVENRLVDIPSADEQFIYTGIEFVTFHTQTCGGVGLGIQVNNEHAQAIFAKFGAKIDTGGGFAHATFLVDNSISSSHKQPVLKRDVSLFEFLPE